MSPAPVRSTGRHGYAGTWASTPPWRTYAPLGPSVTSAEGTLPLRRAKGPSAPDAPGTGPAPAALPKSRAARATAPKEAAPKWVETDAPAPGEGGRGAGRR